jgi:HAD superfamily hydrolase (TIGR01509 family)
MRPWDLAIFDCDGVLVDSEPISNRIFTEMLNEIGLRTTHEETMRDFVGRSMASCMAIVAERLGRPAPDEFVATMQARTFAAFRDGLHAVPHVGAALDALDAAGIPTCVASSGEHEKMRTTLGITGLLPRVDGRLFSATEVPRGKPHPDLFLHAARRMGAEPSRCAVVEDSPVGVRAAVAAGMTVLGFATRGQGDALAAAGAVVFDDMRALPRLLGVGSAGVTAGPNGSDGPTP